MKKVTRQQPRPVELLVQGAQPILALERRIAFDGAAAATVSRAATHRAENAGGPGNERGFAAIQHEWGGLFGAPRAHLHQGPKSVVFIESDVPDIQTLIRNIDHSAKVVILDASQDGVDGIANYLSQHKGVRNVYIFSHGSDANLNLGTASLNSASMQAHYAADLATIKASLGKNANILVYGCDFAQGDAGDSAARLLSQMTGASVAASTNDTGGTVAGGDFVLEDRIGHVSAPDVLKPRIASRYDALLASPTTIFATSGTGQYKSNIEFLTFANTSLATGGITNGATATYTTAEGSTVTITFSNVSNATNAATFLPAALSAYKPSQLYQGYNNTASTSDMLYGGYKGTASFTVTITATDKNGKSYTPNLVFADGEVTESTGESYAVTTNGGNFQTVETVGATGYTLTGAGTQSITLKNDSAGVPLLVTTGASVLNLTVTIAGGKEGFAIGMVVPTLTLDANNSSGSTGNNYVTTFTEKGSPVSISDTDTVATEPGVTTASSAKIVLTNAQASDLLSVGTLPTGITSSIDTSVAGQITVNLSGTASLASYQTAIHSVTFSNTSSNPSTADRTLNVTFNDGSLDSNTAVSTIHVAAVNDAPVEVVPGAKTTDKDTALAITGMSVSDVDANGGLETVTLSVADGTISLASTTGLSFATGTGTNDTTETFTGTLSAINNAISSVKYQPTTGYVGSDTLNFSTNDNGNTGSGGAMTASQTIGITVNNVNPTPKGTIANQTYKDGQSGISIATSQAFSDSLGLTLTYSATGLPTGLSINKTTGQITGTIDHDASKNGQTTTGSGATLDGKYTVLETASDGQGGSTTQTFTIDSTNQAPAVGPKTANQTNNDGDTITAVNAAAAFSDSNGDPLIYTATNLPPGLTISSAGMITGTVAKNATPGTYNVTVTATDDKGAATPETFTWTINDVPPATNGTLANQSYADGQPKISISTSQGFTDSNGNTLTYSATGLPSGLTIDPTTGQITGTIDHDASKNAPTRSGSGASLDGTYLVKVTASDGLGGAATQAFTIDAKNTAPAVGTSTANQTNNDGDTITAVNAAAAFSDSNGDPLTYTATNLPPGLAVSSAGMITGTVAKNAAPGTYNVTVTATDDKGAATPETFTWTINDVPPATSGTLANQSYTDGQANVSIATSQGFTDSNGNALTYKATGLPAGLTIDPTTSMITGTIDHDASKNGSSTTGSGATLDGTYKVTVIASDGLGGTAQQTFTIDSMNKAPIVGTKTADQANNDGDTVTPVNAASAFSDPNGDPLTYTASSLPAGLTISSAGVISGTVAKNATPGTYNVTVTATDDKGAATSESFHWVIDNVPPTANGTLANQAVKDGQTGISIATSQGFTDPNGNALTYSATGLPTGLSIDPTSGLITGTIDHDASKNGQTTTGSGATLDGTYTVVVTAVDSFGGSATQSFKIDSTNQAPNVGTPTANQTSKDGQTITPVATASTFSDPNGDPLTYSASNLPAGLTIDPNSGIISGTIAANAAPGTYAVRVLATDDKGAVSREAFRWTIQDVPPTANGTLPNKTYADSSADISIATAAGFNSPNKLALTYSASGLPSGLSIDPSTGKITGQLDHDASKNAPTTTGTGGTLDGTYTVVVTASDGQGGSATQTFKIDATNTAPTLVSNTPDQHGADGNTVSVNAASAFTDVNTGDTLTYTATSLPKGLTINATTGVISGTIDKAASASGPYAVQVTATDDKGAATTETFNWVIDNVPPQATTPLPDKAAYDGSAVSITSANGFSNPNGSTLAYSATGLPMGLSINTSTGVISGTLDHDASVATANGVYTISVVASDGQGGSATNSFHLTASNQAPVVGTQTANQASNDGQAITPVDASKAFSDPNGDPLTYTASNLPAGLTIDPSSGMITGTVAANSAPGTYAVRIVATDDKGAATRELFTWTISDVPPTANGTLANQSYPDSQSGITIETAGGFSNPNGLALTYTATGLPPGLSIDPKTGAITGQLDHDASKNAPTNTGSGATLDGTYSVTVTASDGQGGTATQAFKIDATNSAPTVTSNTPDQHDADGNRVSVDAAAAFSDANVGDTFTYVASGLPKGLSIDPNTGLISGTIDKSASVHGPYTVTVTETDDKGAATTETFHWQVDNVPLVATPPLADRSAYDSSSVSYATSGGFTNPNSLTLTYTATGLPTGLTINSATGVISGTLDHDASKGITNGVYTIAVTVDDGQGSTATNTFHLTASNQAPVVGTKTVDQSSNDGQTVTTVDASQAFSDPNAGDTLTYAASNLPAGLTIDAATGKIAGTVAGNAAPGVYAVSVTATDDKGAASSETFNWTIADVPPAANGTLPNQTFSDAAPVTIATSSGFTSPNKLPLTYSANGLPTGLAIDPTTGQITGQLDHDASANATTKSGSGATLDGTYTIVVTAADGQGGSATQTFTLDAKNDAPTVSAQTPDQHGTEGNMAAVNAAVAFTDQNTGDSLTYVASGLPNGLAIDPNTGRITGTIAADGSAVGSHTVTVTATDDKGAATTESFAWQIDALPPGDKSPIPNQSAYDGAVVAIDTASHFTSPDGTPLLYSSSVLPSGLRIDATTGQITGTLDHDASKNAQTTSGKGATLDGTYTITVTATGTGGAVSQTFALDVANQAPTIVAKTADQANATGQAVTTVDTSQAFHDPNGDTLTYAAANLPAGLSFDSASGKISGTVATNAMPGTYAVSVTATDDKGAATVETFNWVVSDTPPATKGTIVGGTYADSASVAIDTSGGFTSPNGLPLTYSATGLPAGLSIDPATGKISGQLDHDASKNGLTTSGMGATLDGTYDVTVTASDGQGGTASQTFKIDATNSAPTVAANTADQHSADGNNVSVDASKAFVDPNIGDTLAYTASGLPAGLAIDPKTGLITGTIATDASQTPSYTVKVTATDDKGAATTETFNWAVDNVPPVATPPLADRSAYDGSSVTYASAEGFTNPNGHALTYTATGLPNGLAINATTGVISGKLDHDASAEIANGVYTIAVTASDGQGGMATNTFHLTATDQAPVVGTKTADQASNEGQTISPVEASAAFTDPNGDPLTYTASNLPAGLSIDKTTGQITGTVASNAQPGSYLVTITATDDKKVANSETFNWSVDTVPPATNGALPPLTFADGASNVSFFTAQGFTSPNGTALTYSATGLPIGLSIDAKTGVVSGFVQHDASLDAPVTSGMDGTYEVQVTATDIYGGTATQTFTLDAKNEAPVVSSQTPDQHSADGNNVSLDASKAFTDPNTGDTVSFIATGLPKGLSIDPKTGLITGTIDKSASAIGPYTIMVTATDDKSAATVETFVWRVDDVAPTADPPLADQSANDGAAVSYATAGGFTNPNGLSLTYTAAGLPNGLTIDSKTGIISGTLDRDASTEIANGLYTIAVTASDGQNGMATSTFHLTAANQAPAVGTRTADQISADGQTISPVDASQAFADPNGDPLTYSAANLPAGLSIDATTGKITGTVSPNAKDGPYVVTVTATDDKGAAANESFTWTVNDTPPVAQGTLAGKSFADGASGVSIATAGGFTSPAGTALTYGATGLPRGLTIDPSTGQITGFISHNASQDAPVRSGSGATLDGTYQVTITATDPQGGTATQTFTIDASNGAPMLGTPTADQRSVDGAMISIHTATSFSDPNTGDTLTFAATGLPKGLSINATTGDITGTIDPQASAMSPYQVTVTATDNKGAATNEGFTWQVNAAAPTVTSAIMPVLAGDGTAIAPIGTADHFASPTGLPLTYTATGLPAGLSIDPATGQITGTLANGAAAAAPATSGSGATFEGSYAIVVTASDGQGGTAQQSFTITATNQAPVIVHQTPDQQVADGGSAQLDATRAFADPNGDTLTYSATNLPPGLAIDPTTGIVSGTFAGDASRGGPYRVTVTATDPDGASTSEIFVYRADPTPAAAQPPAPVRTPTQAATAGAPYVVVREIQIAQLPAAAYQAIGVVVDDGNLPAPNFHTDDVLLDAVNRLVPLDALPALGQHAAVGTAVEAASAKPGVQVDGPFSYDRVAIAPAEYLGSSSRMAGLLTEDAGTTINVETLVRDRVIIVTPDNRSDTACVVPVKAWTITRADGSPLPTWLHVDAKGTMIGKVPGGVESIDVKVKATLANGIVTERTFTIDTAAGHIKAEDRATGAKHAGRSLSQMLAADREAARTRAPLARLLV